MQHDQQEERQQRQAAEVEGDRHGLMLAPIEPPAGQVQAGKRQPENQDRPGQSGDRALHTMGDEVEQAAGKKEERAEIQRNLRVRQRAARDDPVVFARLERAIG